MKASVRGGRFCLRCTGQRSRSKPRVCCALLSFFLLPAVLVASSSNVYAQTQVVTEGNIGDAILERQPFSAEDLDSLDVNRDGLVNIADLILHMLRVADVLPSVSFASYSTNVHEGDGNTDVRLIFTKAFEADTTLWYALGGTAAYGAKSAGGDYTIAGYDPNAGVGFVDVPAGIAEAHIPVVISDDAVFYEGTETITFSLLGDVAFTYFLGGQQNHILYLEDNDGLWTAGLDFPEGGGYESFKLEIAQEDGVFAGRVLADGALIPMPQAGDANGGSGDGWDATFHTGSRALRIEIGPIPVDKSLSFFDTDYSRYYVLEVGPGLGNYVYDPYNQFAGVATERLEPVEGRLGQVWHRRAYLRRESRGIVALLKHPSQTVVEEVVLQDAG